MTAQSSQTTNSTLSIPGSHYQSLWFSKPDRIPDELLQAVVFTKMVKDTVAFASKSTIT